MNAFFSGFGLGERLAKSETPIGDRLPYARHVDDSTLLTRDGLLIQTIRLDGFPFETADDAELSYRKQVRETLLRSVATSRLALYHHVVRRRVTPQIEGTIDDPFCADLAEAWQRQLGKRRLFLNDLYLTLVHRPLQGKVGLLDRLIRSANDADADMVRSLRELHAVREAFCATLAPYGPYTLAARRDESGDHSEPCGFLMQLLTGETRRMALPVGDIGKALGDRRLTFGLDALELGPNGARGREFAAAVSIKDYPARSSPGLLDGILRLPCELVLTESFAFADRQVALGRMGLALRRLKAADDDAYSLREELAAARDEAGAGRAAYGEHHLSIILRADDLDGLNAAVAEAQSALTETGGVSVREDINLEPTFWAQFPGNFKFIARKALISAANFASFASLHNHSVGQAGGAHWGSAVTVLETTAHGPYYFNFHNGDLGNFTAIGPSGSGKTVLVSFLLAQARKFNPRIFYFDKDRGAEAFIRASGGTYDILRPDHASGLNPLQLPDTPTNRAFLTDWLAQLLGGPSSLDVEDVAVVADAIQANFEQQADHRRLRYLQELFVGGRRPRAGDLAARLRPWCEDGEHAWLFDNPADTLSFDRAEYGFDMTRLLDTPVSRTPAMMYLFHRIEQALDGQPAIIVVDEGWKALDDDVFTRRLKDWEKTIRKRNGIVGFCTQNASDALESRIASAIVEQSATQIFLPNPKARAADYIDGFGLTPHEFDLVRCLPDTSRCFLIKQADHSVVARLDLGGMKAQLAVLAGTERSVRRLDLLRKQVGDDPAAWLPLFQAEMAGGR